ncbi:MAG: carbohydrate-binding domain-containing protein [Lachnospiraceae bacterium]|nr:carbohydrate-binding domain-containing protein [Lachnospiraceae bacterium]
MKTTGTTGSKKRVQKALAVLCAVVLGVTAVCAGMLASPMTVYAANYTLSFNNGQMVFESDPPVSVNGMDVDLYSQYSLKSGDTVTITLDGTTTLSSLSGPNLIFQGPGTLNVNGMINARSLTLNGGTVNATNNTSNLYGVASVDLTVNGGTLNATGSETGIQLGGNARINGGVVNANGGSHYGIQCYHDVAINGGTVTAYGAQVGITTDRVTVASGATLNVTGGEGINASTEIDIANGANVNITASSGPALGCPGTINAPGYTGASSYVLTASANPGSTGSSTSTSSGACTGIHKALSWQVSKAATAQDDGEEIYVCAHCGAVLYRVPVTGYGVFQKETIEKIRNAAQGDAVEIKTARWISFHRAILDTLATRPDVTLKVSFLDGEYKGNRCTFTIPAGTDINTLLTDESFYGFFYLAGALGTLTR